MSKSIELNKILKNLKHGLRVSMVEGKLECNYNKLISLFDSMDLNIVELSRLKSIFSKLPETDIYHPNFLITSSEIEKNIDIASLPRVVEAYENKKGEDIKGGIVNGNYKDVIRTALNHAFQNKIMQRLDGIISNELSSYMRYIDKKGDILNLTPSEIIKLKSEATEQHYDVIQKHSVGLKKLIKQYCIFNPETKRELGEKSRNEIIMEKRFHDFKNHGRNTCMTQTEMIFEKFETIIDVSEASKRIKLDSDLFTDLFVIELQNKKEAQKLGINYEDIFNKDDIRKAA